MQAMSKLDVIDMLLRGVSPTTRGDTAQEETAQAKRALAAAYYERNTYKVRRRQLVYNLNHGRTKFPSISSIRKYDLVYDPSTDTWA